MARFARLLGHRASIVVPSVVHASAVQAIRVEGAEVLVLDASHDEVVAAAARIADEDDASILVQDTDWPGYEEIPGRSQTPPLSRRLSPTPRPACSRVCRPASPSWSRRAQRLWPA